MVTKPLKVFRFLSVVQEWICCGLLVKNKVASASETRLIDVGAADATGKKKLNKIKTSKYTLLTFIPKNLSEQFRRIANFYFLIVTVIAIVIDSPVSPMTSIAPLSFMVLITAVKQGYEDWLRHRTDNRVNNQIVEIISGRTVKEVRTACIAPGTLVRVRRGRDVPADLALLCAAGAQGTAHVTTANLDGETSLKTLRVPPPLVAYTPDILPSGIKIEVPPPIADLYTFYGRLDIPGHETMTLSTDNIMLRGSRVKNTEWAIGCAVYTGEETKLALNSRYTSNKFSSAELIVNKFLVLFIGVLIIEIVTSYVCKLNFERKNPSHQEYLGSYGSQPPLLTEVLQDVFSFLLLYYYIIPMSLYVTIELYKFIGALFIGWDVELRSEDSPQPAAANTSDLNEELGQVQVLFSDKTGTLTKNLMVFKACSVNGRVYEERNNTLYDTLDFGREDIFETDVQLFFTILALCHSVQISTEDMKTLSARLTLQKSMQLTRLFKKIKDSRNNSPDDRTIGRKSSIGSGLDYQASSPDEKALVQAADRAGVTFLGEDGNNLMVKIGDDTELFERLQVLEFNSDRKRMSVVVKDKNGKIWLFCKGAESSVLPLCKNSLLIDDTNRDILNFANKGLRTLAVAYREIPQAEYDMVTQSLKRTEGVTVTAEMLQQLSQQYLVLERGLTLLGATAVEDCLQDHVADTIAALRRAGIKIWVLTGDKVETAINVAQSCAHISENDKKMFLINITKPEDLQACLDECWTIATEPSYQDLTLVVDGTSIAQVLNRPSATHFVELALKCNAVLCCRLSPIQKAMIVKLVKSSDSGPITAAIGDGANDISMIQEAHVGIGIYGKEGYQAARCADFAFTKFSMVKKLLLVMGHWYYQRLATLIHYFFYKNLVFGTLMFFYQVQSGFSTQSIFDSLYLTLYNLVFTSLPCLILSVTEQRWPANLLLSNPTYYRKISKNKLLGWSYFAGWFVSALYHAVVIYFFTMLVFRHFVISKSGQTIDLWCYGAIIFHYLVVITNLKLWLHARYHSLPFVASVIGSILFYIFFNTVYSMLYVKYDGDVEGTYILLLMSPVFWLSNIVVCCAVLLPDFLFRAVSDIWHRSDETNRPISHVAVVSRL